MALALLLRIVSAPNVIAPNDMALLVVLIVPFNVLEEGAVAVIPPT